MAIALTSPITGLAQTGFTSPTYTIALSNAPDVNGKQYVVSALGGTQTDATAQTGANNPFSITWWAPKVYKPLPAIMSNGAGFVSRVPRNVHKLVTRKGVLVSANQPREIMPITTEIPVPAGSETASPAELRAALSAHAGALMQLAAGLGDTVVTGIV